MSARTVTHFRNGIQMSTIGIRAEFIGRGHIRLLNEVLSEVTMRDGVTFVVRIPKGFTSDGASSPWFSWWAVGHKLSGSILEDALVHDYLLRIAETQEQRWAAHRLFRVMLEQGPAPDKARWWHRYTRPQGRSRLRAYTMWFFVSSWECWRSINRSTPEGGIA